MLKVLIWLAFDFLFIKVAIELWNETGEISGYLILAIALIAFFTWELIRAFREWLK